MKKNILVVYYSHSNNTRKIAELINQEVDGTLFEILPKMPYPDDYDAVVEQAKKEIQAGFMPELEEETIDLGAYDTIFVGTPNWWSTIAPPVFSFLNKNDMTEKNIIPFCTHGGGGLARIAKDIAKICTKSTIMDSLDIYEGGGADAQVKISAWIKKLGLK